MRKESRWETYVRPRMIERLFPPRISRVLRSIPVLSEKAPANSYYFGGNHTGKTIQAAQDLLSWYHEQYLQGHTETVGRFVKYGDMLAEIKKSYSDKTPEHVVIEKFREYDMLIIDDFGTDKATEWLLGVMYAIIDYRYENDKTTVYTSNFSVDELPEHLGDSRIPSRIVAQCYNNIIEFTKYKGGQQ